MPTKIYENCDVQHFTDKLFLVEKMIFLTCKMFWIRRVSMWKTSTLSSSKAANV